MQTVEEPLETIHVYYEREKGTKPFVFLPLFAALLCLAAIVGVTIYSALYPTYERETLTLPARFLPLQTFIATEPIMLTGVKTFPATAAHGTLTLTNGSVITMELPAGMIISSGRIEVQTDAAVTVPPGNAEGYGTATVSAHAVQSGRAGNIQPLTINQVYGTSLFIRNLSAFRGGKDAYTLHYVTSQDKQTALDAAKASVTSQEARIHAMLAKPCKESVSWSKSVQLTSVCQFVAYPHIPGKIISVRLVGKHLFVEVTIVVQSKPMKRG